MQSPRLSWCGILFKKKTTTKNKKTCLAHVDTPINNSKKQVVHCNYLKRVMRDCLGCLIVESGKNHANGNMLREKRFPFFLPHWPFPQQLYKAQHLSRIWSGTMSNCLFVLNVPATCKCISEMDLLRQFYVLPLWDRSCRPNFPSHPVTIYWQRANQSQRWPYNARRLAG